jgi:DNA replication and repair protein RecF
MVLKHLSVLGFKNYSQLEINFGEKVNCLVGKNGAGKTNILDAIHYLGLTKSYLNVVDSQNIQHGGAFLMLDGTFSSNDTELNVYCGVKRNQKKIFKYNGKDYTKLSDHIGKVPVVMISPTDYGLILEGSEERRKFINNVIAQYNHAYLDNVIQYNKLLTQRNKLLKGIARNSGSTDILQVITEQMEPLASTIFAERLKFTDELIPIFQEYFEHISNKNETVSLEYQSQLLNGDFLELSKQAEQKDLILQYSTIGIHKDDLILKLGDHPIKKTGSQGQQKTFLVALKLAKFDFIFNTNGIKPILLLDDIFDKFDSERVSRIISLVLSNKFGQTFITDTNEERLKNALSEFADDAQFFKVEKGTIEV